MRKFTRGGTRLFSTGIKRITPGRGQDPDRPDCWRRVRGSGEEGKNFGRTGFPQGEAASPGEQARGGKISYKRSRKSGAERKTVPSEMGRGTGRQLD